MTPFIRYMSLLLVLSSVVACNGSSSNLALTDANAVTPPAPTTPTTPTTPIEPGTTQINPLLEHHTLDAQQISSGGLISVDLSADDVSILLNLRTSDAAGMAVTEIRAPNDEIIYSADIGEDGVENVQSEFFGEISGSGELAVFMPATPRMTLQPGRYQFRVVRENDAEISSATAFVKSNPDGGDIDATPLQFALNVWVAHADEFYSSETFQNTVRNSYVDTMNAMLQDHNLSVGSVNFFEATAEQTTTFRSLDVDNEYSAACRAMLADTGAELSLNLVFVEVLTSEEIEGIGGVSAAPGMILDESAGESCFFVAQTAHVANADENLSETQAEQTQAGNILHEASHFMSIPHTTEENGTQFDRFDDTPQCDAATYDGRDNATFGVAGTLDGVISDHECSFEGGADNVMFYAGHHDFLPFRVSEDQAWILRRHPLAIPE